MTTAKNLTIGILIGVIICQSPLVLESTPLWGKVFMTATTACLVHDIIEVLDGVVYKINRRRYR